MSNSGRRRGKGRTAGRKGLIYEIGGRDGGPAPGDKLDAVLDEIAGALGMDGLKEAKSVIDGFIDEASREKRPEVGETGAPDGARRYPRLIGGSPAMLKVFDLLDKIVASNAPVLIQGESGTGKELVARSIHEHGARSNAPFISENCSSIPETLLESELFGYKRGAFTGAYEDKQGLLEAAHRGTLFLDEIGDMSPGMQKKLLRSLQNGEIRKVGGKDVIKVDVRLLTASNKDLRELVRAGVFREDLFYRINVLKIDLPPLRDRLEDVPELASHFADLVRRKSGGAWKEISAEAMEALEIYRWPGNVRELENEVLRAYAVSGDVIRREDLSPRVLETSARQ